MTAPVPPVPDSTLVSGMMAGDEAALAAVYDRYSAMLFGMLIRILQDRHAAEEVLQDIFLQLWRGAGQFDSRRGSLAAWLLVIGRSRAISRLRRRSNREVLENEDGDFAETFASAQNVEDEAGRAELAGHIAAALATLPAEQRQVLELAYFEGMTQTEIAAQTGCPLGTVKTRIRTGTRLLKQIIDDGTAR